MLNQQQAAQIVLDCIRATSGLNDFPLAGSLDQAGIRDGTLQGMISLIVNDPGIGVRSQSHQIAAGFFQSVDTNTKVLEVTDIVRTKSIPISV